MEMEILNATDIRKNWGAFIDSIVRDKPRFIKRSRDYIFATSIDILKEILDEYKMTATLYEEKNGTITATLKEMDIVSNGSSKEEALDFLADNLIEYAEEYYREFEYWYSAPNRKKHLPYILKVLSVDEKKDILDMIKCQTGKI